MKNKSNAFWIISAVFLSIAALWSAVSELSDVMENGTICGIALIVFGVTEGGGDPVRLPRQAGRHRGIPRGRQDLPR